MASSLSSNRLLISALAKRQTSKNALQAGFTLIELLVVIIIIGILASVALPAFLNQAEKAKASSAKSLTSGAAKECAVYLVENAATTSLALTTKTGSGITFPTTMACPGTIEATIDSNSQKFSVTVGSGGEITAKNCTAGTGCTTTTW